MTQPGNIWQRLECLDENQHAGLISKDSLNLGKFVGTSGKEDCLAVCRIFALTGCEWITATGECLAHLEKVSVGKSYKSSHCYTFNSNPSLGKKMVQVKANLTLKNLLRLRKIQVWFHNQQACATYQL